SYTNLSSENTRYQISSAQSLLATKSAKQAHRPNQETLELLDTFRRMVNDCIDIGLASNVTTLKRLAMLSWPRRRQYGCPDCYKACAASRAAGILAARKKSLRRGIPTKNPYSLKPQITAYRGFKIKNAALRIPVGKRNFLFVPLISHILSGLSDPALTVRSFTLTPTSLSLCISKEVPEIECADAIGVDRNLRNLAFGNEAGFTHYDLSRTVRIAETSVTCPQCGERLQEDRRIRRKLWCGKCRVVMDRDVVAAINLTRRGRLRFDRSRAQRGLRGRAVETLKRNPTTTVILRADALKPSKQP